ncbi:hypothetical protein SD70_04575 [Gordoniibacillus kamchatkensis]|uniref:Transcriptional regulator n=1 Tax=Gordoniibacillus kamchatkensis TaxID=1590651 RepID=A0ABR5ALT1_9BACL|nr:hypothetical protein SD70_04575 [Paenibacillus sp. VKM B-2647]
MKGQHFRSMLARQKRSELEEKRKQIDAMIQILDNGLSCKCLSWSECLNQMRNTDINGQY